MKNLILVVFVISILFWGCDKKEPDPVSANNLGPNLVEKNITASEGGSLSTSSGIRLDIPAGALDGSGTVTLGVTGNEINSVPNSNFQIVNTPFTIKLPASKITSSITLSFPIGSLSAPADRYNLFLYNGSSFYPFEYSISGNTITGTIDKIDWETSSNSNSPEETQLYTEMGVVFLLAMQTPPSDQMGLKKVILSNGMQFSNPNAPSGSKNLLFIHGWVSSPTAWGSMISKFNSLSGSPYSEIWTFGYNSALSVSSNASNLSSALNTYCLGKKVDIVAHSMGGLVARYMIEKLGGSGYVNKFVTLGTPHSGSPLAALRTLVGAVIATESITGSIMFYFSTQGLKDLKPGSSLLNQLSSLTSPSIPYYTIAAKNNPNRWLISNLPFLPGDDDGAVTVTSASAIPNATSSYNATIDQGLAHCFMQADNTIFDKVITWLIGSQQTGKISGQISDATSGNSLSGVTVSLKQSGTTISTTTSNSSGYYEFTNVAVGSYEVAVSKSGYISTSTTGVSVIANQTVVANFSLLTEGSYVAFDFETVQNNKIVDRSTDGNRNGSIEGINPTFVNSTPGRGKAASFNGSWRIVVDNSMSTDFRMDGEWTMAFSIFFTDASDFGNGLITRMTSNTGYCGYRGFLVLQGSGDQGFSFSSFDDTFIPNQPWPCFIRLSALRSNNWNRVVIVHKADQTGDVYINGIKIAENQCMSIAEKGGKKLSIGGNYYNDHCYGDAFANGTLVDDFVIIKGALTAQLISGDSLSNPIGF